jgi:hypothetical protein
MVLPEAGVVPGGLLTLFWPMPTDGSRLPVLPGTPLAFHVMPLSSEIATPAAPPKPQEEFGT